MINIAICDDDEQVRISVEEMIREHFKAQNIKGHLEVYFSADKLLGDLNGGSSYDLIFLDIEMEGISGIELGRIIREKKKDEFTKIVYISHQEEYAMDLFKIRPMDFLVKPVAYKDVIFNIDKSIEIIGEQSQMFRFAYEKVMKTIPIKDIIYFESSNRQINMYTVDGIIHFYEKLEDVEKRVDERYFWRIHKSYLINSLHAEKFEYTKANMSNGIKLSISQKYRSDVRQFQKNVMGKE